MSSSYGIDMEAIMSGALWRIFGGILESGIARRTALMWAPLGAQGLSR